ncbi:hypothetical protein [Actinoplanes aureus]|uniref:Uncharacterized protein n=1 Tax=Actinoplanes aureus TaxID=2792083 RepID=A0A931G3A3_9ACTN|nr:hypothetical protein [Actinoplanes aureus]MBG0568632.1 hypothetical protein [Actinoplanes aureus]
MAEEDQLRLIDELLARPFPAHETQDELCSSGPGHHLSVLQASRDFWDDPSTEVVEAAEQEIDVAFQSLVSALTSRWGKPEPVDLDPYLWTEEPAPQPMLQLSSLSGLMLIWRQPSGRWVALAVGQADREFPVMLLAAVGNAPVP